MNHVSQKSALLHHLRNFGSITTLIAFKRYQICRLSERIREIEADFRRARSPALIHHVPVYRNNRRYMSYSLVEGLRTESARKAA